MTTFESFDTATDTGANSVSVTLSATPDSGDVLVVIGLLGAEPVTDSIFVATDDDDSVILDPGGDTNESPTSIVVRLIRCAGAETTVTVGTVEAVAQVAVGVWRFSDEARIEPYPVGADNDVASTTPAVPAATAADAGYALAAVTTVLTSLPASPGGWTEDAASGVTLDYVFLRQAVSAGAVGGDAFGGTVSAAWTGVIVCVSDLAIRLAPMAGTGEALGARVVDSAPAEIPPPLEPDADEYPPLPPDEGFPRLPLPPWLPGPQYRPEDP